MLFFSINYVIFLAEKVHDESCNNKEIASAVDPNELLIAAVSKRPLLYDFRISLSQRSKNVLEKLWQEVSSEVGGQYIIT